MTGYDLILTSILNFLVNYYLCFTTFFHQATPSRILLLTSSSRLISSAARSQIKTAKITYAKCELDSHADIWYRK